MSSQRVEPSRLGDELPDPETAANVTHDPSFERLREFASHEETTTEFGSPRYVSDQRSRSADRTKNRIDDGSLTRNGRAVVLREHLNSAAGDIDLDEVDQVFFITRNPLRPPVARLTPRQAAVAFMLGESVQTSAGDPDAAGASIRVVGTNPFIIGPEGEEGNRFSELLADNDVDAYLMNTGTVGPDSADIWVEDSINILVAAARGDIETSDETLGLDVPTDVPGVDIEALHPAEHYDDYAGELSDLRAERRAYLAAFETLAEDIKDAVY